MEVSTPLVEGGAVPKHAQLREWLLGQAAALDAGDPVPSERTLMQRFDVSRGTVRKAVDGLIDDGVLSRSPGRGTYVAAPAAQPRLVTDVHLASFTRDMAARGLRPESELLGLAKVSAPAAARGHLGVGACWHLVRLRRADGEPMAYEESHLRADLLPDLDTTFAAGGSVYDLLAQHYDVPVDAAEQVVWAEGADERVAGLLGVAPGAPLMVFERRSTSRGRPVEVATSWYRADRYSLQMHLAAV
ncbi:GntR family transcriptional regulator [Nocardioides marmoraquaticus]